MEEQSNLSANRRKNMQQFILASLITEIKRRKSVNLSQIPAEIVELLYEEAAKNPAFKKIFLSWLKFREDQLAWHRVAEHTMATFSFANKPVIKTAG